jgi:hypothetical protein
MYYTSYHATPSAAEEIDQMAKRQQGRCYFCRRVGMGEATYAHICFRHRLLISLRLLFLVARSHRSGRLRRIVKCWR